MVSSLCSLQELLSRLSLLLVEYRRLLPEVALLGVGHEIPVGYLKACKRVEGWSGKFKQGLRGDADAVARLDLLVGRLGEHPSKIAQHHISICIQDIMVGNLQLIDPTSEPDGPVGGETSGVWRHAGKIVSGLGSGKAFHVFFEAHSIGLGKKIACEKFTTSPKVAVRGVTKIIDRIEAETQVAFEWQLQEARPFHVKVIPRKKSRADKGIKQISRSAKPSKRASPNMTAAKPSKPKPRRPKT
jgi:hypothetical protein